MQDIIDAGRSGRGDGEALFGVAQPDVRSHHRRRTIRGHLPKGGYDVQTDGRDAQAPAPRRQFDDEFKAQAVRLVLDEGKTVGAVARDLDLTESALREWVERARADRTHGKTGLTTAEREELARLRKENRSSAGRAGDLKKGGGLLREASGGEFRFIAAEKAHHSLTRLSLSARHPQRVLRLAATAGIGAGPARPPVEGAGPRVVPPARARYGSPRIHRTCSSRTERVSRKRVIRLMQEDGLKARRPQALQVHDDERSRPAGRRQSARSAVHAERPNQRWVGDTTEFVIGESGKLYLAAILDLFSRFVVGWAVSAVNDRHLTIKALEMALKRAVPTAACSITPTRAAPTPARTTRRSSTRGITCSMSRRGNCYDNAVMESFFSTVKSELADRFESFGEAKMALVRLHRGVLIPSGAGAPIRREFETR